MYGTSDGAGTVVSKTVGQSEESVRKGLWGRIRRVAIPAAIVLVLFTLLGAVRSRLARVQNRAQVSLSESSHAAIQENTWTSVLLTNLAQADQFKSGIAHYLYGETYLDYLLSLPPNNRLWLRLSSEMNVVVRRISAPPISRSPSA